MAEITEIQIIESLKQLKEIKPRKEWAYSLKFEILNSKSETNTNFQIIKHVSNFDIRISSLNFLFQRKLAYAFALVVLLIIGFGFTHNTLVDDQAVLKQSVAALSNGVSDLTKQGRTESVMNEIKTRASEVAKNTKSADPEVMKEVALSLKTLADVIGVDLSVSPDVENLYQAVVENQIADLENSTLTEGQQEALNEVKDLYDQGKYADALEKILLIH